MKDKYYIGTDLTAPDSQDVSTMVIGKSTLYGVIEIIDIINLTPFCPICHNCMEDNKLHSQNIKICPECAEKLMKHTCYGCDPETNGCEYAFDEYNTSGDCLASK